MTYKFRYDPEKNAYLLLTRGVGFEDIIGAIETSGLIGFIDNPISGREHQKVFIVEYSGYVYTVPAIDEGDEQYFLKTVIPSRKYKKKFSSNNI